MGFFFIIYLFFGELFYPFDKINLMDKETLEAATKNLNLPHDIITLPTQGIFYKNKKKTVKVGYLTANDENILASIGQSTGTNIVLDLIRSKLYENDLKPEEMMEGDIQAILIFLRNTAFGPEYNVELTDPKTGKIFSATLLLDELNIKKPEHQPNEDGTFSITLPRSGDQLHVKLLSYYEDQEIENSFANYPVGRVAPIITTRLLKQIESINGNTDKNSIAVYISQMPIIDSKYIRKFLNENQPKLDLTRKVRTPSGETVDVNINFGVEFFRPFF